MVRRMNRPGEPTRLQDFNELTKDSKKYEGFITLHEKDQHLYAEIKPQQLEQPILAPMVIARGSANAGQPLNFGDEWVLVVPPGRRQPPAHPQEHPLHRPGGHAAGQGGQAELHRLDPDVLADPEHQPPGRRPGDRLRRHLHDRLRPGRLRLPGPEPLALVQDPRLSRTTSRSRSRRPSAAPASAGLTIFGGPSPVVDSRGITMVLHYSLCKAPDPGYHPRMADYRVGHFLNAVTDFANPNPDTNAKRMINRWRLEKANPEAKLSPPKKQIVWYIEDNVPEEYRPYVQEGILEWNKAFEKIGFKDAIAVRWQNERDDFEPEDINYCTLRWITTGSTFAMSGLRSNPMTGEMIDGDVIFDASWIKTWKEEYAFLWGCRPRPARDRRPTSRRRDPAGHGRDHQPDHGDEAGIRPRCCPRPAPAAPPPGTRRSWAATARPAPSPAAGHVPLALDVVPAGWDPIQAQLQQRLEPGPAGELQLRRRQVPRDALRRAGPGDDATRPPRTTAPRRTRIPTRTRTETRTRPRRRRSKELKLPEEFLGQAIKEVVMHEVGHSLGLRHNFKASIMLRPDQINDTSITRVKGMTGSVMDYNPINVAPKGQKQGDYASTTIGPYDYWAIEYAYTTVMGNEEAELKKIAARSPDPDLAFATDDDFMNNDPQVNTYDLTSDTLAYGKMRMAMASELLKDLDQKVVKDGESWARLRSAFMSCINQFGNGAYLAAEYIGGQSVNRDFKGTDKARDPVTPIAGARQREALKLLVDQILSDKAFQFSPGLAPQADHRVVAGQPVLVLRQPGLPDLPADPQHPGDRARPVPRSRACSSGSRTRRCRAIPAAIRSRSPRSSAP